MADVLDQSEVDALLEAVGSDAGGLLSGQGGGGGPASPAEAAVRNVYEYDFKRPERVSKDQMRALEGLHENFARSFGASISSFLRSIIEVQVAGVEQLTYSEFIYSLPNPTCFNLLKAEPLKGQMCLEISPLIAYPIIDRLLGGSSEELYVPQRPLTEIESRLIRQILDRALVAMTATWSALAPIKFELTESESNPHLVQIVAPSETVVIVGFELKAGPRTGTMSFCIPFTVIEPIVGKLGSQSWLTSEASPDSGLLRKRVLNNMRLAKLDLRAFLAETTMTMGELMSLRVGDVIRTDKRIGRECIVQIEGRNKYACRIGQHRGKRAVRLTRAAKPDEFL
jgi:flagellar motor switch protein FliM